MVTSPVALELVRPEVVAVLDELVNKVEPELTSAGGVGLRWEVVLFCCKARLADVVE